MILFNYFRLFFERKILPNTTKILWYIFDHFILPLITLDSSEYHDNLVVTFVVRRTFLYYLYRAYIPIMLLMVFNIGSYWIPDTALPARVTLIVTTFLTNVFILQSVSEQTVRVSNTTSLQVYSNSVF